MSSPIAGPGQSQTSGNMRTASDLFAELARSLERRFDHQELQRLSLFSLFSRVVDVEAIFYMGVPEFVARDEPKIAWYLPECRGFEREDWNDLAHRAAEMGIISESEKGFWFIEAPVASLLQQYLSTEADGEARRRCAFVESIALRAHGLHRRMSNGDSSAWRQIAPNEANMLKAISIATESSLPNCIICLLEALQRLYSNPSRLADWERVLELILPVFADIHSSEARPGLQSEWHISSFRVQLLIQKRDWQQARDLQSKVVDAIRLEVGRWLDLNGAQTLEGRREIARLVDAMSNLAFIESENGNADLALDTYRKAYELSLKADSFTSQRIARNLAAISVEQKQFGDADRWYAAADGSGPDARSVAGRSHSMLARARAMLGDGRTRDERSRLLESALALAREAQALADPDDPRLLGTIHSLSGSIQAELGLLQESIESYMVSLFYRKAVDGALMIGQTEGNLAGVQELAGHRLEAIAALQRALRSFEELNEPNLPELEYTRVQLRRLQSAVDHT